MTRTSSLARCRRCRLHAARCVCALLPRYEIQTKLRWWCHPNERRRLSSTGALLAQMVHFGQVSAPTEGALLYPGPGALPLHQVKPPILVIPDGTWRETRRMLQGNVLQKVALPQLAGRYVLRTRRFSHELSTLESVAVALGLLESTEIEAGLISAFELWQNRVLEASGRL